MDVIETKYENLLLLVMILPAMLLQLQCTQLDKDYEFGGTQWVKNGKIVQ